MKENGEMGMKVKEKEILELKCPERDRPFYDYSEFRLRRRLRDHMKDKHRKELVWEELTG
jgi:hypothetical protein